MRNKRSGFSILSLLVASSIGGLACFYTLRTIRLTEAAVVKVADTQIAESYAVELLELFRAMTSNNLKTYLSGNPYQPPLNPVGSCGGCTDCANAAQAAACSSCTQCTPYSLCSHVNILDRHNSPVKVLNEDPIAALPITNVLEGSTPATKANRFFQVQIIDLLSLSTDATACSKNATQVTLTPSQRYFVTVGVSWVPRGSTTNQPERIVLSAVIP